ncbi:hypothetical protein A2U01_0043137 [Trifolium medium]|uniref:Uncharacterized protein n=1 Tax=Trifolium medium TaxID=97028 RepID=A0A392QEM3_9FABA|nr:hypothetical protein [Trifolium medium]
MGYGWTEVIAVDATRDAVVGA